LERISKVQLVTKSKLGLRSMNIPEQRQWIQLQALTKRKMVPKLPLHISLVAGRMTERIARGML